MSIQKSKKYKGVFWYCLSGDRKFFFRYIIRKEGYTRDTKIIVGLESEGFSEAKTFAAKIQHQTEGVKKSSKDLLRTPSFIDLAQEYFALNEIKTIENLKMILKRHVFKYSFAAAPISQLTAIDIQRWQKDLLNTGLSKNTINCYTDILSSIINFARKNLLAVDALQSVPLHFHRYKNADKKRLRFLSKDEITLLLDTVSKHESMYLFVLLAISTGARFSSIMDIKKKDVNLDLKTVNILDNKRNVKYTTFLNDKVIEVLNGKLLEPNDHIISLKYARGIKRSLKEDALKNNFKKMLLKILDSLFNRDLDKKDTENRVVIHTLRHTFASQLAIQGESIILIQKLLNHASIQHTQRYIKLHQESGRDEVEKMTGFIA